MMFEISAEARRYKIAVVTLMPGFMRTGRVVAHIGDDEKLKKAFRFDLAESTDPCSRGRSIHTTNQLTSYERSGSWHALWKVQQNDMFSIEIHRGPRWQFGKVKPQ